MVRRTTLRPLMAAPTPLRPVLESEAWAARRRRQRVEAARASVLAVEQGAARVALQRVLPERRVGSRAREPAASLA